MNDKILTGEELMQKLNAYASSPDDNNIRFKEKIKNNLLQCPELLYALNNHDLESELLDTDGNINYEGDWSMYFGDNIRPYVFLPEVQTIPKHYVCYNVNFDELPRYNKIEYYCQIVFTVFCDSHDSIDLKTGIARHDLLSSILRERFNWSNIFGTQCKLVSNKESVMDANYIARTMIFESTLLNGIVKTENGKTSVINYRKNLPEGGVW